jgi:2-haloacid dehalogenase
MDVPSLGLWGQRWDIHGAAVYGDDMDKWVTFDCYGTIADWNSGMLGAIDGSGDLLGAYHREELRLEAGPYRTYREILTEGLRRAGALDAGAFVRAWPSMPVFADAGPALSALASDGWKLAILTNCDDDLFATTRPRLPVGFDLVVTAQQVRSYKPDLGHFAAFAAQTGATPSNWVHAANSWVHDILPAARMGLRSVWIDRDDSGHPAALASRRITSMRDLPDTIDGLKPV